MTPLVVFTIGHSTRPIEAFIRLLWTSTDDRDCVALSDRGRDLVHDRAVARAGRSAARQPAGRRLRGPVLCGGFAVRRGALQQRTGRRRRASLFHAPGVRPRRHSHVPDVFDGPANRDSAVAGSIPDTRTRF